MKLTLGKKLGLAFGFLIVLYSMIMGIWQYQMLKENTYRDILESNRKTVGNVQDYYLDNLLEDMSRIVLYWSLHPSVTKADDYGRPDRERRDELSTEWKSYMVLNRNVSSIYFGSSYNGKLYSEPADIGLPDDYDARRRAWFQGAVMDPGEVFWSRPYKDAGENGAMVLTVSKAVRRDGIVVGVIGMDIKLYDFSKMLTEVYSNQSGYILVMNPSGEVYAHPDNQMITANQLGQPWANDVMHHPEGTGLFKEKGRQMAYAFATLPETGWKLIGFQEVDTKALVGTIWGHTIGMTFAVMVVILLAGLMSGRFILRPLQGMMETIREVSEGNLRRRPKIGIVKESKDEIGEISTAFDHMIDRVAFMNKELEESVVRIRGGYLNTVRSLANAIEADNHYTHGHCERVSEYGLLLGKVAGYDDEALKYLEFAGLLHDVGKIGIPDGIVNKPGRLTEDEFRCIRKHPEIGAEILSGIDFLEESRMILLQHHERIDGRGYPAGLTGADIHCSAKILAIADSYDAMTSNRPYRERPMTAEEALRELIKGKGTQFDDVLTDQFVTLIRAMNIGEDAVPIASGALDAYEAHKKTG